MAEVEDRSKRQLRKYLPSMFGHSLPIYDERDGIVIAEQMFANYKCFIKAILPVALEACEGVVGVGPQRQGRELGTMSQALEGRGFYLISFNTHNLRLT